MSLPNTAALAAESVRAAVPLAADPLGLTRLLHQQRRMLQVETALPTLSLVPERVSLHDAVGQPFELVLEALSTNAYLSLHELEGQQMSVRLLHADGRYRPWHGYVTHVERLDSDGGLARYRLLMRPWLVWLDLQRDSFVYQDLTAQSIIEQVFADYPEARFRFDVTEPQRQRSVCMQFEESDLAFVHRLMAEEGWTYRFEHLDTAADGSQALAEGQALHELVITDRNASWPDLGPVRFTSQHATARTEGQRDALTAFVSRQTLVSQAVTLGAWNYKHLAGTSGQATTVRDHGAHAPALEVYDGGGAYRYEDPAHAERVAAQWLSAIEQDLERFEGQGSARHVHAGGRFTLADHSLFAADQAGFKVLAVTHLATNNLGPELSRLRREEGLERGTYRQHLHAVREHTPVVPRPWRKPTAPAQLSALVVAAPDEPLSTDRDHRIKVQFHWQRGVQPNVGGLAHDTGADTDGNAPGDDRSGTWVRVAPPSAGANWGAVFTPRAGSEVVLGFIDDDIDRPVVLTQIHNGQDTPPFAAGADAGVNHPGFISGWHTHRLDAPQGGGDHNQWVIDDATGQLRMRLVCSYTLAELGLGHLIHQTPHSAQRGAWRGQGFEAGTQGWASVRAGRGLLVSTTARPGTYGSAHSTQMDTAEALAQLRAAQDLGRRLGGVSRQAGAHPQSPHEAGATVDDWLVWMDPQAQGRHPDAVNGQAALQAQPGGRAPGEPVHALAQPVVVLDTPSAAALSTEASVTTFSGRHSVWVSQGDWHEAAQHTHAQVSGGTTSLHTHQGGIKAFAASGPVSLRAHTDTLSLLADRDVTVMSVHSEVRVQASSRIELVGGQSSLVLDGGNITFTCPGAWKAKGATKSLSQGGSSQAARLAFLPTGTTTLPDWIALHYLDPQTREGVAHAGYEIHFSEGIVVSGTLDEEGKAMHPNVQRREVVKVVYLPRRADKDRTPDGIESLLN